MKQILIYCIILISILVITQICCTKAQSALPEGCVKVRMLGYLCGQANFQILDSKYYDLGEDAWIDGNNKKQDHVFKSLLTCTDLQTLDAMARPTYVGMELAIKILEKQEDFGCAICKALLFGPTTFHFAKFQGDQCK